MPIILCKLCRDENEGSKGHPTLCKKCFNGVQSYRRFADMEWSKLTILQQQLVETFDRMFEANHNTKDEGWYVPKFYYNGKIANMCEVCGMGFRSIQRSAKCFDCR